MLAINSYQYCTPIRFKSEEDGQINWKIYYYKESNYIVASHFVFTFVEGPFKASFTYSNASVKPTPRTLRVYGASALKDFVSKLSCNSDLQARFPIEYLVERSGDSRLQNEFRNWIINNPTDYVGYELPD